MSSRTPGLVFAIALAVSLAGCRQTDGPMPAQQADVPNRLGDLERDLVSVSRGDVAARQDFADDLRVFVEGGTDDQRRAAADAINELSRRVVTVVADKPLSDEHAQQLAERLWTAVAAQELSSRQVETLQTDLQGTLVAVGVPEGEAQNVAAQVEDVQRAVTRRQRRWYEFF